MSEKYCPKILSSCLSRDNLGYNWTLEGNKNKERNSYFYPVFSILGVCISKQADCPELKIQEVCNDLVCPKDQYLCHPKVKY